jgi:hypothetical protein
MWAVQISKCDLWWRGWGVWWWWIYIIISVITEHPITAVVWSDILRQSETPDASLHNGCTIVLMSMSN